MKKQLEDGIRLVSQLIAETPAGPRQKEGIINYSNFFMKHNVEIISDDNGFELLVSYDYEQSESQIEEGHGLHEVGLMVYTELKTVEIVIAGKGIELLKLLTDKQKQFIISKLQYE